MRGVRLIPLLLKFSRLNVLPFVTWTIHLMFATLAIFRYSLHYDRHIRSFAWLNVFAMFAICVGGMCVMFGIFARFTSSLNLQNVLHSQYRWIFVFAVCSIWAEFSDMHCIRTSSTLNAHATFALLSCVRSKHNIRALR